MIDEAVILLGGMGTRLLPYTKSVPKEMLPVYDVPNIFLLVREAYLSGIRRIIFVVTEHNKQLIQSFFSNDEYLNEFLKDKPDRRVLLNDIFEIIENMEFTYTYQVYKGTYGALYSAQPYLKSDNFIVMYGDDLVDSDVPISKNLIDNYHKTKKMQVTIYKVDNDELPENGIVKMDDNSIITGLVNKNDVHSHSIVIGRMLLNKKIFDIKNKLTKHDNDEYYLPHALLNFNDVIGYQCDGKYFNLGSKTGFIKASIHYALKDKKQKDDLIKFIKEEI